MSEVTAQGTPKPPKPKPDFLTHAEPPSSEQYYILSLKWSKPSDALLTWWEPNNCGYTHDLNFAGKYSEEQVLDKPGYYNNGETTLAIPVEIANRMSRRVVPSICTRSLIALEAEQ